MGRISLDEYHLEIARAASTRSSCNRAKVGAVIANKEKFIHTGYNGSLSGHDLCNDTNCTKERHCLRTTHAEINALHRAFKAGWTQADFEGATMYCTHKPCYSCTKTLAAFGVRRFVYAKHYEDPQADEYCKLVNIIVEKFEK